MLRWLPLVKRRLTRGECANAVVNGNPNGPPQGGLNGFVWGQHWGSSIRYSLARRPSAMGQCASANSAHLANSLHTANHTQALTGLTSSRANSSSTGHLLTVAGQPGSNMGMCRGPGMGSGGSGSNQLTPPLLSAIQELPSASTKGHSSSLTLWAEVSPSTIVTKNRKRSTPSAKNLFSTSTDSNSIDQVSQVELAVLVKQDNKSINTNTLSMPVEVLSEEVHLKKTFSISSLGAAISKHNSLDSGQPYSESQVISESSYKAKQIAVVKFSDGSENGKFISKLAKSCEVFHKAQILLHPNAESRNLYVPVAK